MKAELAALAAEAWGASAWNGERHDAETVWREDGYIGSRAVYGRGTEEYTEYAARNLLAAVLDAMDRAAAADLEVKETEWALLRGDLEKQAASWEAQMAEIISIARSEWNKAFGTVNTGYNTWRRNYVNAYNEKALEWEQNYGGFLAEKAAWAEEQYLYAANVGNAALLEKAGADTEGVIARTMAGALAGSMEREEIDASGYADTLLEGTNLGALMGYAGGLAERGKDAAMKVKAGSSRTNAALALAAAEKVISGSGEEMRRAAAKLAAGQAERLITEAEKGFAERLESENEGMLEWEERLVRSDGYEASGSVISREAVADSTIAGAVRKKQTVHRYEYFRTTGPVLTVDLSNLEGLDADVIMALIDQANREISAWSEKIFGRMDEATRSVKQLRIPRNMGQATAAEYAKAGDGAKETEAYSKLLGAKYDNGKLTAEEEAELERLTEGSAGIRDGELGAHIGFAPKFKEGKSLDLEKSRSGNIEYAGAGEMGLIMLDFQWNAMMNSKGYSELAKPMYDQKLWAEEFLGIKPPTLRSVTDMAVSIAAGILTAGAVSVLVAGIQAAAIGLIDDLVFAGIDVGGSYKSPGEVAVDLGKKVVVAAASIGINTAFNGVGKFVEKTDITGKVVRVAEAGNISKLVAGSLGDGFGYSYEAFADGAKSGLASAAAALTGTFTAGALGLANLKIGNDALNGDTFNVEGVKKLNSFTGGLAGAGVSYAITGEATLNVLNLKDLTKGKASSGLLELRLGGEDGASMSIGTGGTDISLGAIATAMAGLGHLGKNMEIEEAAKRNGMSNAATGLRGLYGFGDEIDKAKLESILSGEIKLLAGIGAGKAQTVTAGGQTYVILNGVNEADTPEKKLALALALSHEGRRDGVTDENNQAETRSAAWAHTEMAVRMLKDGATQKVMMGAINGDENLRRDLNAYATAKKNGDDTIFDRYVDGAYDSSADFWRLKAVLDANGNVKSYTVDWDDSLDLNIENADGTIKEVAANAIQTESGIDSINQWFRENGLAFSNDIKQGFVSLGMASEAATALTDAINNEKNDTEKFKAIANNFTNSIDALINSGLNIGALETQPDQSTMYSLMPDSTKRTTLYGIRLVTPELKNGNVTGTLYNWATYNHFAEDIAGGEIVQTPTTTNSLKMAWSDLTGFKVTIGFDNGYTFENNHLSSDSTMNLLQSMLLSGSTTSIAAGLRFATVGTTGAASTGPHNHLVGSDQSGEMKPTDIFAAMGIPGNYKNSNTELTGFPVGTAYNDPLVLQDILKYGGEFDRQAYVNAHKELFQPYIEYPPNVPMPATFIFDILTMSYQPHWLWR